VLPQPSHARKVVLELGELDLELPLGAERVLGKDVEDQLRSIDDPRLQRIFEPTLLGRRQFPVDEQRLRARVGERRLSSSSLPLPTNERWSGRGLRWTMLLTASTPAVRASSSISASSRSSFVPEGSTATMKPRSGGAPG
jgi:hypothetical protein